MNNEEKIPLQAPAEAAPAAARTDVPADPYAAIKRTENSYLPDETLAAFKQWAAEANLPAEALAKWVSHEEARLKTAHEAHQQAHTRQVSEWAQQTKQSFGPHWQEEVSRAVRAADAFGGPELRQFLEETGLGNHPVLVRTFHRVAMRMSEDVTPGGTASVQTDRTFTQALYGKN